MTRTSFDNDQSKVNQAREIARKLGVANWSQANIGIIYARLYRAGFCYDYSASCWNQVIKRANVNLSA